MQIMPWTLAICVSFSKKRQHSPQARITLLAISHQHGYFDVRMGMPSIYVSFPRHHTLLVIALTKTTPSNHSDEPVITEPSMIQTRYAEHWLGFKYLGLPMIMTKVALVRTIARYQPGDTERFEQGILVLYSCMLAPLVLADDVGFISSFSPWSTMSVSDGSRVRGMVVLPSVYIYIYT